MNKKIKISKTFALVLVSLQIALLIGMSFSESYQVHEVDKLRAIGNVFAGDSWIDKLIGKIAGIIGAIIFSEKGMVSALEQSDLQTAGAYTCLKSKTGSICQQFIPSECDANCDGPCIPSTRDKVAECKLGTCFDSVEGLCSPAAPKAQCDVTGGQWFDDAFANIQQCQRGCCVLGDNAFFVNERTCAKRAETSGIKKDFRQEIQTELECLVLSKTQAEGACVFESAGEKTCKFTTASSCAQIGGELHSGFLCSNSELKTNCKPQDRTSCFDGRDEVYWIDSCGNKENIYSAAKTVNQNNGKILGKNESCSLIVGNNLLAKQETCGNCNHFLGSTCGTPVAGKDANPLFGEFVCRDLNCVDENGKDRHNGESWCAYTSAIGTDSGSKTLPGGLRSVDTPGSRNFRKICINGEVRTEPCADFRNEICAESQTEIPNGKFSTSACRINRWQECIDANQFGQDAKGKDPKAVEEKTKNECGKNSDCFIKKVDVDKGFKFNICAPKYPEGFDLKENGQGAQQICSIGSQKCTVIYVKKLFSGWTCVANCDCEKAKFTEQMNDLCMSLGDCGASVNYAGKLDEAYSVKNAPKLAPEYLNGLKKYANPVKGQFADPGNLSEFIGQYGIPGGLGNAKAPEDKIDVLGNALTVVVGKAGVELAILHLVPTGLYPITATKGIFVSKAGEVLYASRGSEATQITPPVSGTGPFGLNPAFLGQVVGAAVGAAVVSLLLKWTGVGAGLPSGVTFILTAAGAYAGAVIGYNIVANGAVCFDPTSCLILAAIIILILILKFIFGIGKTKKVIVQFTCQPWQAPNGGSDCKKCGKFGLPCSKYQCESLGQTCVWEGEELGNGECFDDKKSDTLPPIITPLRVLYAGNATFSISHETGDGFTITGKDECAKSYETIPIGIQTDESAQCKMDFAHTDNYEAMENSFGESNLYVQNHTMPFSVPSFESIAGDVPGFDPNARKDFNLFVRCKDRRGNADSKEYAISFCVKPGEDTTPPGITGVAPTGLNLAWNASEQNASVFTNEPADCKWDTSDKDYYSMANRFACLNDIQDQDIFGWECNSLFPITNDTNKFYVRCLDKPWLNETDSDGNPNTKRNKNTESYPLVFKRSSSALNITSITPNGGILRFGVEPATVEFTVQTDGGIDGTATCSYSVGNQYMTFQHTYGKTHTQTFNSVFAGDKDFPVRCEDLAGNVATAESIFSVVIDRDAPTVTRVYNNNGLTIVTNENATCAYTTDNNKQCDFEFENGTTMNGEEIVHTSSFDNGLNYYIKCKDSYEHAPGQCSLIARGVDLK